MANVLADEAAGAPAVEQIDSDKKVDLSRCRQKSNGRSYVWTERLFLLDLDGRPVCTVCCVVVATPAGNTTNLIAHYSSPTVEDEEEHKNKLEAAKKKSSVVAGKSTAGIQPKIEGFAQSSRVERVREDLLNWVILDNQALAAPEHPALVQAFRTATGSHTFNVGGRKTFSAALKKKKEDALETLKAMLVGTSPAATTDIWTSASGVPLISLSLHWISTSNTAWTARNCTAACEVFTGSHTGARIAAKLMGMLKNLNIDESVTCITTDTAANQRNAVEVHMPARIKWLGCGCHKTELTVNKFVSTPALKKTLNVFSKLAAHLHRSALSQKDFEEAQKRRFPKKQPRKIPTGCVTRWWSWFGMLSVALEHKSSVVATLEIANDRSGVDIEITHEDWGNALMMERMLEPFKDAVLTMEGNYLGLAQVPCVMAVLNAHIEAEATVFEEGPFADAGEVMLLDHADRWVELPDVMKMASALSPRTKGLDWIDEMEKKAWRALLLDDLKVMFSKDIRAEAAEAGGERRGGADRVDLTGRGSGSGGGSGDDDSGAAPAKKQRKRSFFWRAVSTAKAMGPGDESHATRREQNAAKASPDPSRLSLTARMQAAEAELQRFVLQDGLEDDDSGSDDEDVDDRVRRREDELSWWCRHQFVFPSLARLAVKYLIIPPSSAASERIFSVIGGEAGNIVTKKRNRLGDDTVDALVFLNGSHGVAWNSGVKQEALGRTEK